MLLLLLVIVIYYYMQTASKTARHRAPAAGVSTIAYNGCLKRGLYYCPCYHHHHHHHRLLRKKQHIEIRTHKKLTLKT